MKKFTLVLMAAALVSTASMAQNKVKNIYASSSKLNMELLQNEEQTVQLNRYLMAGYNTLCLPMTLTADQLAAAAKGVTVERMVAIGQEGTELNLFFVDCTAEGIQAGVPYLIYSPTAQYLRVKNSDNLGMTGELKAVRMTDAEGNQVTFSSSYEALKKEGRYGIPAQQNVSPLESVLVRTEADKTFLPTRCGFSWDVQSPSATRLTIKHVASLSEVTAIKSVESGLQGSDEYYNLGGKKQNGTLRKGIYVKDNDKVIVK